MSVLVAGVRVNSITIKCKSGDDGGPDGVDFEAGYSLMTDGGVAMAKQTVNGYSGDVKLNMSAEMATAIKMVSDQLKKEVEAIIGIAGE